MMTNERAIELLHRISDSQFDGEYGDERREALEMAVRALEQNLGNNGSICTKTRANDEETGVNDEDRITDDLISRKQVLNASHFVACWDGVEHFSLEVVDADFIQKLPSVQPTQSNAQSTQINTLDCVSRQAAIDALTELRKKTVASDSFRLGIYYAIEEIKNVSSAQSDSQEIGYWECSNALLKMWIDNVLTDGEYYRIADKLNTYWKDKIRSKNGE